MRKILWLLSAMAALPAAAADHVMLHANFNNQTVGSPPQARGANYGEPVSVGTVVIAQGPLVTPNLQIIDNSTCCASSTWFEFLGAEERTTGTVQVRANFLLTGQGQPMILRLGERGGFSESFIQIITPNGVSTVSAGSGQNYGLQSMPVSANTLHALEANVSVEHRKASVKINGVPLGDPFEISTSTNRGIGRLYVGSLNNPTTSEDIMRIDDIRVVACDAPVFAECILVSGFDD